MTFNSNSSIIITGPDAKAPIDVSVGSCNNEYCEVKRNTPAKIDMTFKSDKEETKLKASVHAQIAGAWIPWPLGRQSNVCDNLTNGKCPLAAETKATYSFAITIPIIAPVGTRTVVELRLKDQSNDVIACTRFPVLVVA